MRASYGVLLLSIAASSCANASAVILSQDFEDVSALGATGWSIQNRSDPIGSTSWFQGSTVVFNSQSGAENAYVGANFNAAGFGGTVSDWLLTPTVSLDSTETLTFYTRSNGSAPDRLEVRLSTNGSSASVGTTAASVGDFSSLLLSVNPDLSAGTYPTAWTLETISLRPFSGLSSGRFAFRYFVSDTSRNGDYIGLDTVVLTSEVPEPVTGTLLVCGALMVICAKRLGREKERAAALASKEINT